MENDRYNDFSGIFTFLSGALTVLAFLMCCFLAWRAIVWLRDRMDVDGGAVDDQIDPLDQVIPRDPWDQAISRPSADHHWSTLSIGESGGLGSMNPREQEELLLFAGTRKQQKAIRKRRRAALAGMSQRQREEFLLIHGSPEERKAVKERWKARQQAQKKQSDS